jgi:hypothetical protein
MYKLPEIWHKSCKLHSRYVKCNGSHHYSECTKVPGSPPNCVNCNGIHPVNYKGCTSKILKIKKTNNTQKTTLTENKSLAKSNTKINTNNPHLKILNPTIYAEITKEKTNPNQTTKNNADHVFTEFLNENLQKQLHNLLKTF